jgi:hypothetical protein
MSLIELILPKWPQMIVTGKPVTIDQAKDIILRTDHHLTHFVGKYQDPTEYAIHANLYVGDVSYVDYHPMQVELRKRLGVICSEYVHNTWAYSSYVYGPHGWCNPDGTICFIDNVGKSPSISDILTDWTDIAEAFPYLDINVTLMSGEHGDEDKTPVVNIRVVDGKATLVPPDLSPHGDIKTTRDFSEIDFELRYEGMFGLPEEWYSEYAAKVREIVEEIWDE